MKFSTNKTIIISIIFFQFIFIACKSFDTRLLTEKSSVNTMVKPMHVIVNYDSLRTCFGDDLMITDQDRNNLAEVIKNNLTFSGDSNSLFLSVIARNSDAFANWAWYLFGTTNLYVLTIFGVPLMSQTWGVELEAAIMQSDGKIVKLYTAKGKNTAYAAYYWGYSYFGSGNVFSRTEIRMTAYIKSIIEACKNLRDQMNNDAEEINKITR